MKWNDVDSIAISLEKHYREHDIFSTRFTDLRLMVLGLPDFDDDNNGCNEKILESIQLAWNEERESK
ncbi:Fe-S cluster assembly protein IscX [Ehrlichia japonica]|uniref:FeS assembly protein IscX n=1 Tax=Ehrlichia japonica TaxID=391036 RepID=X5GKX7_9RICK|nr:Fe-S cluster assembly protein IscX [Ehrlichia japonica]AHX05068.1 feS assembly protein IscX [Ehrlichia japonica]